MARRAASQDVLADMCNVTFCWCCFHASRRARPPPMLALKSGQHKAVHLRAVAHGALCGLEVAQAGQELATMSLKRVGARQLKAPAAFAPAAPFIQLLGTARPLLLSRPVALIPLAWSFWP